MSQLEKTIRQQHAVVKQICDDLPKKYRQMMPLVLQHWHAHIIEAINPQLEKGYGLEVHDGISFAWDGQFTVGTGGIITPTGTVSSCSLGYAAHLERFYTKFVQQTPWVRKVVPGYVIKE